MRRSSSREPRVDGEDGLGKTRQASLQEIVSEVGPPRGILRVPVEAGQFRLSRRRASDALAHSIAYYWIITWDLLGCEPHVQETLPHPNVHVSFERGRSEVWGVVTGKFSRRLEGRSHVFGIKFVPGGFRGLLDAPVSSLTDRSIPARRVFGHAADVLEDELASTGDEDHMVATANDFFAARVPAPDAAASRAASLVERILGDRDIRTVDDLVTRVGIKTRSLQRLFSNYVGVSPKWVIRRYRLHEIVERLATGENIDFARLAYELGYFDQAHLINDFRSIVGYSPTQYQQLTQ